MQAGMWRRKVGDDVWSRLLNKLDEMCGKETWPDGTEVTWEDVLAEVMTEASELGWRPPERPPEVNPAGTKIFWPRPDGGVTPALTAKGLELHWARKGHGFVLLRAAQLCRAVAGPLLPRLQEVLQAYEEQCYRDEVTPLPLFEGQRFRPFVGGVADHVSERALLRTFLAESPDPDDSGVQRKTVAGPGSSVRG